MRKRFWQQLHRTWMSSMLSSRYDFTFIAGVALNFMANLDFLGEGGKVCQESNLVSLAASCHLELFLPLTKKIYPNFSFFFFFFFFHYSPSLYGWGSRSSQLSDNLAFSFQVCFFAAGSNSRCIEWIPKKLENGL